MHSGYVKLPCFFILFFVRAIRREFNEEGCGWFFDEQGINPLRNKIAQKLIKK